MSQTSRMDPDIPVPSIENEDRPAALPAHKFTAFRNTTASPLANSSPSRTPFRTPLSHRTTPAPSGTPRSPSLGRNERTHSPSLQIQRSSSSLSLTRGQTPSKAQLRRVSSNLNPSSPSPKQSETMVQPMTAESVAREYFLREIESHIEAQSETVVIVHDSCYGHRFSRPRTSKAALSTIVERPERIHATLLGTSTAFVRLGERHVEGRYGPHPSRDVKKLPNPPFLLKKTTRSIQLNHPAVTHVHGTKWMEELQIMCNSAESKLAMNGKELQRPIGYGKDENGNSLPKLHDGDLYLCSESLTALQGCLGGVCDATDSVFGPSTTKRAFVCIRPPGHHCSSNYPSGFCWLNNVHVGISYAAMNHGMTHAAIIDFDLHHGDGSQTITWDHNRKASSLPKNAAQHKKTPIGYYSLHDINSYPCEWGDEDKVRNASLCIENAHGQSIWNVHLEPWRSLEHFWQLYETKYSVLLEKTKSFLLYQSNRLRDAGVQPKGAIFISAGFDASQWEGQGMQRHNVNVPTEFYARFTADIVKLSEMPELGVSGRVISVLEGGYSDRALTSGVFSHLCGLSGDSSLRVAGSDQNHQQTNGPGIGKLNDDVTSTVPIPYDPEWWHEINLGALENRVAGNTPSPPKSIEKGPSHFSSPTQASTARMTDVARERKSLNAQMEARLSLQNSEPEPPPPVDWLTSSYELSQILIPGNRQTLSCRHDELNAEATKARRERQSAIGVAAPPDQRMQLRTRGKAPNIESDTVRTASRNSSRRTTIAAVSELPDPSMPLQHPRRRSSAASSILSSFQDLNLDGDNAAGKHVSSVAHKDSTSSKPADNIAAKKTRMAPPPRKVPPRVSSPRKAKASVPPGTKPSSLQEKLLGVQANERIDDSQSASQSRPSNNIAKTASDGVDELTNGMRKVSIKLNMPTPEQHAENQRKAEEAKAKKPRVTRKPPVPKSSKAKQVHLTASPQPSIFLDPNDQNTASASMEQSSTTSAVPTVLNTNFDTTVSGPESISHESKVDIVPDHQPPILQATPGSSLPPGEGDMNPALNGIDLMLESRPALSTTPLQSPRSKNHIPQMDRTGLPVFTSSSPIPFAPTPTSAQHKTEKF